MGIPDRKITRTMSVTYAKFGKLLWEQGYFKVAETLANEVLDTRDRILRVEH